MAKKISRTLIIGLGGTGQSVIKDIKKRMFRRYGEIPPLVKFLSIDTDDPDYENVDFQYYYGGENIKTQKYNISKEEFNKICRPSIDTLEDEPDCDNLNHDELASIYSMAPSKGANGFRVMGRAHILYNARSLMEQIEKTVHDLRGAQLAQHEEALGYELANNGVTVYIIASIAGGTGSSSFLDISRMVQHAGVDILPRGEGVTSDSIFGVFFMPSFFLDLPNTPNILINSYVALSELDYLLGLNDNKAYPAGCMEKENDLNTYGNKKEYKSVRYSNVYLVDNKTKKGNSHSLEEASGYVASFITASIASDSKSLQSSYVNSTHIHCDVEGKKQLYSGLGYCEARFDRQNLVKYLLNKQISKILSTYKSAPLDIDNIADEFISSNHLDEGVKSKEAGMEDTRSLKNELTESIYKLDEKRFTTIAMGRVETGNEAATQIETNKTKYITSVKAEINEAIKNFALQKKGIIKNLDELLATRQIGPGFGDLPDLAKRLKRAFEDMKSGLEEEIVQHEIAEKRIEDQLKKTKNTIANNTSTGFLGIGSQVEAQRAAINSYYKDVDNIGKDAPTLLRMTLEIARKKEAVDVYDKLIKLIETYYKEEETELGGGKTAIQISGSATEVQRIYDDLKGRVESELMEYSYSKSAKNETIYVDAYFKEYFDNHENEAFELSEQNTISFNDYIKDLFTKKPNIDKGQIGNIRASVLDMLPENVLIRRIEREELSLDQLFVHCFGTAKDIENDLDLKRYPHLGLFKQIETLFDPLWQYDDFRGGNSQKPELQCIVGVNNKDYHLFDANNGYRKLLSDVHKFQYINVGDPDRIMFVLLETSIPGFKMRDAAILRDDYKNKKKHTYSFSDRRLEEIDMLFPESTNEMGAIAWAYGWMFGLIASVNGRIQLKASQAYLEKVKGVAGNSGYYDYFGIRKKKPSDLAVCHKQFVGDEEIFTDIYNQAISLIDSDKPGCIIKVSHWVNDGVLWENRGKLRNSMNEAERFVIQSEPKFLEKRFARLNSQTITVSLNSFGKVEYTDSLGILAEAEKAYKSPKTK